MTLTPTRNIVMTLTLVFVFSITTIAYAMAGKKQLALDELVAGIDQKKSSHSGSQADKSNQREFTESPHTTKDTNQSFQSGDGAPDQVNIESTKGNGLATPETVKAPDRVSYGVHKNITVTFFWVGEEAGKDNKNISNSPSAWDDKWVKHFGGVDDPEKRDGYFPAQFTPKENPFYFALPYNDFDSDGERKAEVGAMVPWAKLGQWKDNESVLKNRWIKIMKRDQAVYAQWQDVGPFKENDAAYVFGEAEPKSKTNKHAGLDVSPAVNSYLGLADIDTVDWQFIEANDVPDGPWKHIVTTSQVSWD